MADASAAAVVFLSACLLVTAFPADLKAYHVPYHYPAEDSVANNAHKASSGMHQTFVQVSARRTLHWRAIGIDMHARDKYSCQPSTAHGAAIEVHLLFH